MSIPVMAQNVGLPEYEKQGLEDGGTIHMECTVCAKPLLDITVTRPFFKFADGTSLEGKYRCRCPYCNNFSKEVFIKGGLATTNIADGKDNVLCFMEDFDISSEGVTVFNIKINKRG